MAEIISQCKFVVGKIESKGQLERSRRRWKDDTEFNAEKECKRRHN
jgi:hypothetical protein